MMRGKPSVSIEYVKDAFPIMIDLIQNQTDEEVLIDTCWALSHALDRPLDDTATELFINAGVTKRVVSFLNHGSSYAVQR